MKYNPKHTTPIQAILIILFTLIVFSSCGYYKETETRESFVDFDTYYYVYVYHNTDIIKMYKTPIKGITCEKIIQVNNSADSLIYILKTGKCK